MLVYRLLPVKVLKSRKAIPLLNLQEGHSAHRITPHFLISPFLSRMSLIKRPSVFISGGSRGIGLAIAVKLAKETGTIYTAAEEITKAGGEALPLVMDVRDDRGVQEAVQTAADKFGGIDILINNASAISLTSSQETPIKRYDLMNQINSRGTYLLSQLATPFLLESAKQGRNPHILTLAPPLDGNLTPETLGPATAYAIAKLGMSLAVLGFAGELKGKVASNGLWPYTYIDTEAIRLIAGKDARKNTRSPEILAEAALAIFDRPASEFTGNLLIDEIFLRKELGYTTNRLGEFAEAPDRELVEDIYIPQWARDEVERLRNKDPSIPGF